MKQKKEIRIPKKNGRPSIYSQELANVICGKIAKGMSLRAVCREEEMPALSVVEKWVAEKKHDGFAEQYAEARASQAQHLFDELLEIADDEAQDKITLDGKEVVNTARIHRARLRVDTRKWYLSKVLPKIYGDKLDMTTNGKDIAQPIVTITPELQSLKDKYEEELRKQLSS